MKRILELVTELRFALDGFMQFMAVGLIMIYPLSLLAREGSVEAYNPVVGYGSLIMIIAMFASFLIRSILIKIHYRRNDNGL